MSGTGLSDIGNSSNDLFTFSLPVTEIISIIKQKPKSGLPGQFIKLVLPDEDRVFERILSPIVIGIGAENERGYSILSLSHKNL